MPPGNSNIDRVHPAQRIIGGDVGGFVRQPVIDGYERHVGQVTENVPIHAPTDGVALQSTDRSGHLGLEDMGLDEPYPGQMQALKQRRAYLMIG